MKPHEWLNIGIRRRLPIWERRYNFFYNMENEWLRMWICKTCHAIIYELGTKEELGKLEGPETIFFGTHQDCDIEIIKKVMDS